MSLRGIAVVVWLAATVGAAVGQVTGAVLEDASRAVAPVAGAPGHDGVVAVVAGDIPGTEAAMSGLVSYTGEAAVFTDCATGESFPIAMEGDYEALEHAYLAAGQEPGTPVMASFEGSIVERPRLEGGGTGPAVLVDRFVGVWPGEECAPAAEEASLTNTYWKVVRLGDSELSAGPGRREPHMLLRPSDYRYMATVGCNQLVGRFELAGDQLRFGPAAATRMACPPPLDAWERQLGWALSATASWRVGGQTLKIYDAEGAIIATFRAVYLP